MQVTVQPALKSCSICDRTLYHTSI